MKNSIRTVKPFDAIEHLNTVRMNEDRRRIAKARLRQTEKFADGLYWLVAGVGSVLQLIGRGVGVLGHHFKAGGAHPLSH